MHQTPACNAHLGVNFPGQKPFSHQECSDMTFLRATHKEIDTSRIMWFWQHLEFSCLWWNRCFTSADHKFLPMFIILSSVSSSIQLRNEHKFAWTLFQRICHVNFRMFCCFTCSWQALKPIQISSWDVISFAFFLSAQVMWGPFQWNPDSVVRSKQVKEESVCVSLAFTLTRKE